jgi:hypothetical protein
MTWFVVGETEQEEELVCLSPAMIFVWLAEYQEQNMTIIFSSGG